MKTILFRYFEISNHYYLFIIEINYLNIKMPCTQNRIFCSDCNKSYITNNYSNHLKSKGHNINVMKKRYCSYNNELTCSMNSLSLEPNDVIKNIIKSEQQKKKDDNFDIGSDILLLKLRNYHDSELVTEAKAMLKELYKVMGIIWGEYISYHDGYVYIRIKI